MPSHARDENRNGLDRIRPLRHRATDFQPVRTASGNHSPGSLRGADSGAACRIFREVAVTKRIIILGASNVALGFPLIVNAIRNSLTHPVQLFAAHGHGRSFCDWSYVLHRGLPGILDCDLWQELAHQSPADRTWGLVTDIGNDLLYGRSLEETYQQITRAMQHLSEAGAAITFVRPPIERVLRLSAWRYWITKQVMFPGPTVPWTEMSRMIQELDQRVTEAAGPLGATVITPRLNWYGIDPIHIRGSQRLAAWESILRTWPFEERPVMAAPSYEFSGRIWSSAPKLRTLWRKPRHQAQPAWSGENGSTVWLY